MKLHATTLLRGIAIRCLLVFFCAAFISACGQMPRPDRVSSSAAVSSLSNDDGSTISASGTVFKSDLEGGFFYIRTVDGTDYVPVDVPAELQVDGLVINFTATPADDSYSFKMAGQLVKLQDYTIISN